MKTLFNFVTKGPTENMGIDFAHRVSTSYGIVATDKFFVSCYNDSDLNLPELASLLSFSRIPSSLFISMRFVLAYI